MHEHILVSSCHTPNEEMNERKPRRDRQTASIRCRGGRRGGFTTPTPNQLAWKSDPKPTLTHAISSHCDICCCPTWGIGPSFKLDSFFFVLKPSPNLKTTWDLRKQGRRVGGDHYRHMPFTKQMASNHCPLTKEITRKLHPS